MSEDVTLDTEMPPPLIPGQVCDRCRVKKIKCNGGKPSCDKCTSADTHCVVSTKLRRKTTARGFTSSSDVLIRRLQDENVELKRQLETERQENHELREELNRSAQTLPSRKRKLQGSTVPADQSALLSISDDSEPATLDRHAYVVKHMGRLVRDETGIGRFAGSTTGVHFVLSVQNTCRSMMATLEPFPEMCYTSHLLQPRHTPRNVAGRHATLPRTYRDAKKILSVCVKDASRQLQHFDTHWSSFCPVVLRERVLQHTESILRDSNDEKPLQDIDYSILQTMLSIALINTPAEADWEQGQSSRSFSYQGTLQCVLRLHTHIVQKTDIWSLQALVVFSVFIQKSGQRLRMIPLNGVMVRTAQSLGLHRHARRFKFETGEVEWRKRIWWSVYIFDKLTSIAHGIPQLISDVDVDNDLPIDCDLPDTLTSQLTHPLPGEPTSVSSFTHYVKLFRIISGMLTKLYTTTDRRGGADKIKRLDMDLQVWSSNFASQPEGGRQPLKRGAFEDRVFIGPWLEILANTTRILIHRPGLTFERTTVQFSDSLYACATSASVVIDLLDDDILDGQLRMLVPSGPCLIFQCGLLQVLLHCHARTENRGLVNMHTSSHHTLDRSIELLRRISAAYAHAPEDAEIGQTEPPSPVTDLIHTLESLRVFLDKIRNTSDGGEPPLQPKGPGFQTRNTASVGDELLQPPSSDIQVDIWNTSGLEALNDFGDFQGMFDFISDLDQMA